MTWIRPARLSVVTVVVALTLAACAPSPSASPTTPAATLADSASLPRFDLSGLHLEVQPDSARVTFTSPEPGFCNVLIGTAPGAYTRMITESMPDGPHTAHVNALRNLRPGSTYYFRVVFTNEAAQVAISEERTFTTPPAATPPAATAPTTAPGASAGRNVALQAAGARITGVSSNYGGARNDGPWGANAAIDGDPTTEWSSNGDGNAAWIEIALPDQETIWAIGFQTRTMGTSAEIRSLRVRTGEGAVLGPFRLSGPDHLDVFPLDSPVTATRFRFEVDDSTGGNTGAREIALWSR